MPHFADEARYRLDEAAGKAAEIEGAIAAAGRRISEGQAAKAVAYELVTDYPAVQILAALAEVTEADRTYIQSALETSAEVRAAVGPLIAEVEGRPNLRAGLHAAVPALGEVRSAGPGLRFEVDIGAVLGGIDAAVREGSIDLATGDWRTYVHYSRVVPLDTRPGQSEAIHQRARPIATAVYAGVAELIRANGHHLCYLDDRRAFTERFSIPIDDTRVEVEVGRGLFDEPERADFLEQIHAPLAKWWVDRGLDRAEARAISARLGHYYAVELAARWRRFADELTELAERIDDPMMPLTREARDWHLYRARLMRLPHESVFADTFSLSQVWQPLRVWWPVRTDDAAAAGGLEPAQRQRSEPRRKIVGRAIEILGRWLAADDPKDALRVVSGGPGAGKSSLARMVAAQRAGLGERVLLIELYRFELADAFETAINRFGRAQGLRHDVLAQPEAAPLLIILDGLDELSIRGSAGRDAVTTLIDNVRDLLRDQNAQRLQVRVLLLGREVVVQGVAGRFRGTGQVLHVLPYVVPEGEREDYADPDGLLAEDQRDGWWRAYGICKGRAYDGFPLGGSKVAALTVEPLLNYLVAIAMDGGVDLSHAETSLTDVYGALVGKVFDRVHAGDGGRLSGVERIDRAAFEEFLRAVAVVAWHGEGRVATMPEIVERCPPAVLAQMPGLEKGAESAVSRLIAAFYFRQPRDARAGPRAFEFTHQSFAEYLIAREIVSFLEILRDEAAANQRHSRRGWSPEAQLAEWARLFGPAAIEPNTFDFVVDGLRGIRVEVVRAILSLLCDLLGRVLRHDFPLSALGTEGYAGGVLARSRNAGEALLVLASGCAEVVEGWVSFDAPTESAFGTWLRRLQPQRLRDEKSLTLMHLARIDLTGARLELADLYKANLRGSKLIGATLCKADLQGANLRGADFSFANLAMANLAATNLRGASLETAHLDGTRLNWALYDDTTKWSDDIAPPVRGARYLPEGADSEFPFI